MSVQRYPLIKTGIGYGGETNTKIVEEKEPIINVEALKGSNNNGNEINHPQQHKRGSNNNMITKDKIGKT